MEDTRRLGTGFIGSVFNKGPGFAGAVWDDEKLCPTLTTMQGGAENQW